MLTYWLCELYLEFFLSLSTSLIILIAGIILVIGILGGGSVAVALAFVAISPIILWFFGWFAEILKNSWFLWAIFGWAIYIMMDLIWIVLLALLIARLFK